MMESKSRYYYMCGWIVVWLTFTYAEYIPPGPKYKCPLPNQIWPCQCLSSNDLGISLRCQDVSLATLSAALIHPIVQSIPVEELHIVKLNTEKLYGNLFDKLNVTKITIENSPIVSIYSDMFYNARETLKELYLLNTQLAEYQNEAYQELLNLETLTIDSHNISSLDKEILGLGSLKNLRISKGNISGITKQTFASLPKLSRLDLHGNQIKTIPKDAFVNQKSLEFLDLSFNLLDKLDPVYFVNLIKLTWFNGSHNAIPDFRRGAFARNGFLRVIHLTHNKLTKIDAAAFRGMRLLTRLYLSDNQISDVGRAAFNSLARIRTIDLARNRLKFIDYQMFSKLPFVEDVNVAENELTRIKTGAFEELAYIVINVSRNAITTIEKESFKSCVNITILDMSHNLIDNFTKGAFDELSYPNEWKLEFNKLKSAGDIPLKFMTGIKILNVSFNELQQIPKNTFPKLYELFHVDLSHNNISKIAPAIFSNLFSIRHLDLSYNNMTDMGASVFGAIPTLLDLNVSHNKLKAVSNAAFTRLASLRELHITNNHLKKVFQIPPSLNDLNVSYNEITSLSKAWPTMNSLLRLDLSGNKLGGNLERGSFANLGTLQKIWIADNNMSEVPQEPLSDLTTVQLIDLSKNNIESLGKTALGRLPVVFDLLLSGNNISEISVKAFDGLLQLLHLDLSNNSLKTIPVGAFSGLVSLRKINLSNNSLIRTENGTNSIFAENLSLEKIDLSHNDISSIYYNTFPEERWTNYKINDIDLSHNHLVLITKELLRGTKKLKKLNLSSNQIRDIHSKIFGNMTTLEVLDLSYNEIGFVDMGNLGPPPNLLELNLRGNHLRKFSPELLIRAPFKVLNLEKNKFRSFDSDYLPKIKNGSIILLNDNPLGCDCRLIPLKRFYNDFRPTLSNFSKEFYDSFKNFKCGRQHFLINMDEVELRCDLSQDPLAPKVYENHDIDIKSFTQMGKNLEMKWRVRSKMDIINFKIFVENVEDKVSILEQTVPYTARSAKIVLNPDVESVCIAPSFSSGEIGHKICQNVDKSAASGAPRLIIGTISFLTLFIFGLCWNTVCCL